MKIWVSGSIAKDLIMDFPGRFRDFIDPKKIHVLNLSFAVSDLRENIGGTGANIAYNLSILGVKPSLLASVGEDGKDILRSYKRMSIDIRLSKVSKLPTAAAYIITDKDDNQITGFHAGAMNEVRSRRPTVKKRDLAIVAAENSTNMINLVKHYQRKAVDYIFDPGQQITALSRQDLKIAITGAKVLIGNDYEIGLIQRSLRGVRRGGRGSNPNEIAALASRLARNDDFVVVRTLGPKGSEILSGGRRIKIGIAKPKGVLDPTGAGDAYRAGFLKGLVLGYNLKQCGQLGATVASFAVEEYGTQNHGFSKLDIQTRYFKNFRELISLPR